MKYSNKLAAALLAGALFAGCNNLDMQPVGSTVTQAQKDKLEEQFSDRLLASATGIPGLMGLYGQVTGDHNDFGIPALMIWMDMRGMDMYSTDAGYNWFLNPMYLQDCYSSSDGPLYAWTYCYNIIRAANSLLFDIESQVGEDTPEEDLLYFRSQAFAFRAYAYFTLAQSFQFTYLGHETMPCVPIMTEKNMETARVDGCPISTVEEVYTQINQDLDNALLAMAETSTNAASFLPGKFNRMLSIEAIYGLQARVALVMNDWAKAAEKAQLAINNFAGQPKSISECAQPSFTSLDEPDWMWGIAMAETDRAVTTGICNFPSHMGSFCYGYATVGGVFKWINNLLFEQIPARDVRRGWWLDSDGNSNNLTSMQLDYVKSVGASAYVQVKYNSYNGLLGQSVNASDIPLMRIEEMYYILAEAQGRQNVSQGVATLNRFVQTYRNPSYKCPARNEDQLIDEIWFQRRIEFWGEGISYYDMLRLQKPLDRVNGGWVEDAIFDIQPTNPVLVFPIPYSEVTANPALTVDDTHNNNPPVPVQ